jgi:hypothetical protein
VTLAIALSLRGSLLDPSTWNSCPRRAGLPAITELVPASKTAMGKHGAGF